MDDGVEEGDDALGDHVSRRGGVATHGTALADNAGEAGVASQVAVSALVDLGEADFVAHAAIDQGEEGIHEEVVVGHFCILRWSATGDTATYLAAVLLF